MTDGMLEFDDMPRRLLPAYPTRLTTWQDCPRRYRFQYLDGRPRAGSWAHFSVGSSVHEALRRFWDLPLHDRTPDGASALLDKHWVDAGFRSGPQSKAMREVARGWIQQYAEQLDPNDEPIGLERTIGTTTEVLSVRGKVDRIDLRKDDDGNDEIVIVDYKTGRKPSDTDDARSSLQLAMYAVAAARTLRKPCTKVELHHVPTGTVAEWRHQPEGLQRHLRRADDLGLEASVAEDKFKELGGADAPKAAQPAIDEVFPPIPGSRCSWCDWWRSCPEGQAVSQPKNTWDALPDSVQDVV